MNLSQLRIGYVPIHPLLDHPGDKRRFGYFAQQSNLSFEIAQPNKEYDLVILTEAADLSLWKELPRGTKVIYDLIDSYLSQPRWQPKAVLRGVAKYAVGQSRHLQWSHRDAIIGMCRRADAVICSTEEQRQRIQEYCPKVSVILDIHSGVASRVKTDYRAGSTFNLVWEGQAENIKGFETIAPALEILKKRYPIALHLVTDLEYALFMRKFFKRNTSTYIRRILDAAYVYEWNESTCSSVITACDVAVIPINLRDPFAAGKPENKLLLFWRMGMPTVVSASAAYTRAMSKLSQPLACQTTEDWVKNLSYLFSSVEGREQAGREGKGIADTRHSADEVLHLWDTALQSVFYDQ